MGYSQRGLHGIAVNRIGQRIVRGELGPGDLIDLQALEVEFDASRTMVREALKVLAAKGLVDARPKRGTFVRPRSEWMLLDPDLLRWRNEGHPDAQFLADLSEVRRIIEPAGARLAAARRVQNELQIMHESLAVFADSQATAEDVVSADLDFHRALLSCSGNELVQRMELVIEAGLRARGLLVHRSGSWADLVPAHRRVLDAVDAGDEDAAEAAMRALLAQADEDAPATRRARRRRR